MGDEIWDGTAYPDQAAKEAPLRPRDARFIGSTLSFIVVLAGPVLQGSAEGGLGKGWARASQTDRAERDAPVAPGQEGRQGGGTHSSPPWSGLPLSFEHASGQTMGRGLFLARGFGYSVLLSEGGATVALRRQKGAGRVGGSLLHLELVGHRPQPRAVGMGERAGRSHYLIGRDASRWRIGVPQYERVEYENVYPGIDLAYYGREGELEYDFVVAPGADVGRIRWRIRGAALSLDPQGNLLAHMSGVVLVQRAPRFYQETERGRLSVPGRYALKGNQVSFDVGPYDRRRPLTIDPILSYSSYLGGTAGEAAYAVAVDAQGYIYLTGYTSSVDFPIAAPGQGSFGGGTDAFIVKLDPTGSSLVYSTYLGGSGNEYGRSIAVDSSGGVYVAGETYSADFPTAAAFQVARGGPRDAFVAKLDASGASLVYSTYLGGSADDAAYGIAVDAEDQVHVVGQTYSSDFPTSNPWRATYGGLGDGFVAKLNAEGSALAYSTFLNGSGEDRAAALAIDPSGNAYVTGKTSSLDFPTLNPRQASKGAYNDAFVVKLTSQGGPVYSTFHGGNDGDEGLAIAADASGHAYVAGATHSTNFPTAAPFQAARAGTSYRDAFLSKLTPLGDALVFSTYLGGTSDDSAQGVAVDSNGRAHLAGSTSSTNFPVMNPVQANRSWYAEAFAVKFNAPASALVYSTYLGGGGNDYAYGTALDPAGGLLLVGYTASADFPTATPLQAFRQGSTDAFVAKVSDPNQSPVAAAGNDRTSELPLLVTLDGSGSSDPNGDPLTYEWRDTAGTVVGTTATVSLALPVGVHAFTLTVDDERGGGDQDDVAVTVVEEVPPTVAILNPDGVQVYAGLPLVVEWEATDNGALRQFDVYSSSDGGVSFAPVPGCTGLSGVVRSCSWSAPGPASSDARLRVVAWDAAGHASEDRSTLAIVDGVIAVTSPNSSVIWPLGTSQLITWASNLPAGTTVNVELSHNGGATWEPIGTGVPNTGSFEWAVRPPHSACARVRITWPSNSAATDVNDADITIGTPAYRVRNIAITASSNPSNLTSVRGTLFFVATEAATGTELWRSDGTDAGTILVKDITPGPAGSAISSLTSVDGTLFFVVAGRELWKSDGTPAGTTQVEGNFSSIGSLAAVDGTLLFQACNALYGCELWKCPSGGASAYLVRDIAAGSASSSPTGLTNVNRTLFFAAAQGTLGTELWKSDGSTAGTVLVKDIYPGASLSSYPSNLTGVGNTLFFTAIGGYYGRELFMSDGTEGGTVMVEDLAISYTSFYVEETAAVNGTLFMRAYPENGGANWNDQELWKSDGTEAGTGQVKDIYPGEINHSRPSWLTNANGTLYFSATESAYGWALWRSDGTSAGTIALKSVIPTIGSAPSELRNVGGALFFSGYDPLHKSELWRTDGTAGGTYLVQDLAAGSADSSPTEIRPCGHRVFFAARDAAGDRELWAMPSAINESPTVSAGADRNVELGSSVTLTATAADPDGDPLTYEWRDDTGGLVGTGPSLALVRPLGTHSFTVSASDGFGGSAADSVVVTVRDTTPPSITVTAPEDEEVVRGVAFTITWMAGDQGDLAGFDVSFSGDGGATFTLIAECTGLGGLARSCTWSSPGPVSTVGRIRVSARDASGNTSFDDGGCTIAEPFVRVTLPNTAVTWAPGSVQAINWQSNLGVEASMRIELSRDAGAAWSAITWAAPNSGTFNWLVTAPTTRLARVRVSWSADTSVRDECDASFTINRAPVADAGGPYGGVRDQAIAFDGAGSSDPDGDALSYQWDFGDGTTGTGVAPTHAYTAVGTYAVTLTVNDGTANSAPAAATVTISNQVATANAGGPYSGVRNQAVALDGSASSDPDGDALTYQWDFGDGTTGTGVAPTHAYTTLGTYTVMLTVNDGTANSVPSTATVTVLNQEPTAHAGGPYSGVRGQTIAFSGAGSSDPDGDALTHQWDFGDGSTGTGVSPTHAYTALGSFAVTLVVNDGMASSTLATTTTTITNIPPTVILTGPTAGSVFTAPALVALVAVAADEDGTISQVEFLDGASKLGQASVAPYSMTWTAASPGIHVLTARATDDSGATVASIPVSIRVNAPPMVAVTAPANGTAYLSPASVGITAEASDLEGPVSGVEFFGDGASLGLVTNPPFGLTWSPVGPGAHTIVARATDADGAATVSQAVTIVVTAALPPIADAYVRDGAANSGRNFGSAASLQVRRGSSGANRWGYVKFDLSAVPAVGSAKLRLFGALSATTGTTVQTAAYPVSDTTWAESAITWTNKPVAGTAPLATVTLVNNSTTARWYEWDVTAYLQQEKAAGRNVVALALKNLANSSPHALFNSKEAATSRPELLVTP